MKKLLVLVLLGILPVTMTACGSSVQVNTPDSSIQLGAPDPNPLINQADSSGRVAGALTGLWHGFIAPATLLVSFFSADVQMYEVHNAGSEYDLGFLVGVVIVFLFLGLLRRRWR